LVSRALCQTMTRQGLSRSSLQDPCPLHLPSATRQVAQDPIQVPSANHPGE
jgi:hypothetical protein